MTITLSQAVEYLTRCADDNGTHWYQGRAWSDVDTCPTCHGSNDAGWLRTPCSRYGHTSAHCAPIAYRYARITSDELTREALDRAMSLVVNDSAEPQETLQDYAIALSGADVDAMVRGYLTCQLWAQTDYDRDEDMSGEPKLDENYSLDDISPEYVDSMRDEFRAMVTEHPLAVRMYLSACERSGYDRNELFGHDFYLTRERHGAGFWDRRLGEVGDYLSAIAKYAGSADDLWDNGSGELSA